MESGSGDEMFCFSQCLDGETQEERETSQFNLQLNASFDELLSQGLEMIESFDSNLQSEVEPSPVCLNVEKDMLVLPPEEEIATQEVEAFHSRFGEAISDAEMAELAKESTPINTLRRNQFACNIWYKWAVLRDSKRSIPNDDKYQKVEKPLLELSIEQLAYWLSKFILEIRKQNGQHYPPKTLLNIVMGIQSHFRLEKKLQLNILNNPDFEEFRQNFDSELKRLSAAGLGSKPRKAEPISVEDEEKLWARKILGSHNPKVLLRTILCLNGKNFALRSAKEHRSLRFKDCQIQLVENQGGKSYLKYIEDVSKTSQGGLKHMKVTRKEVVHYENTQNPDRCHIAIFKKYMEKCPKFKRDNDFYLTPLKNPKENIWYSCQPVGVNSISKYTSEVCHQGGISGYHTNHSWRATAATRLFEANVDEQLIMERTGHRTVEGVRSYKRSSDVHKQNVSDILNAGSSTSTEHTPPVTVDNCLLEQSSDMTKESSSPCSKIRKMSQDSVSKDCETSSASTLPTINLSNCHVVFNCFKK